MSHSGWPCPRASLHRRRPANSRHHHHHHRRRSHRTRYRVAPSTPLLSWNSNLLRRHQNHNHNAASSSAGAALALSSRKLAAGLWHLRFGQISAAESPRDRLAPQLESSLPFPNCVAKSATKSKSRRSKDSDGDGVFSHQKILTSKRVTGATIASELRAELAKARSRVRELEAKKHSLRKKVKHLLSKLEEERMPRHCVVEAIDELRDKLMRERKSRRRMEILNTKLVDQLAEINLSSEQLIKDYEEEKKSRELHEELCDKLVQRVAEDKARVERLKRECERVGEELEEERNMLQLAEVWREERVQMKLVDARLALEGKFAAMNALVAELETLLRSASCSLDAGDLRKAEQILQAAAKSLSVRDVVEEFVYVPPESNDVLSVLRELRECERETIGPCNSRASRDSDAASPAIDETRLLTNSNRFSDGYQSSSRSAERRRGSAVQCSPVSAEMSEASASSKKAKRNVSPIPRIRRSKTVDDGDGDGREVLNGAISGAEATPAGESEGPRRRSQRISACLENPHVARGMRGCIEWPKVIQKNVLKPKISEAIIESQKSRLRHILKPKT